MPRPSWESYFLKMADNVASRATCIRRHVGAVAVDKHNRIIATGYNGPPSEFPHCTAETCYRTKNNIPSGEMPEKCYAIHAEQNLICYAGRDLQDATVYVTHQPCITCFKMLLGAGVGRIVWNNTYPDEFSADFMKKIGQIQMFDDGYCSAISWVRS